MALSQQQIVRIEDVLRNSLRRRFKKEYNPEPASMPFHTRLLGKDRLALYSFLHSLNTNFGTTIFEPVALALALASSNFQTAHSQQKADGQISSEAENVIQNIMRGLETADSAPDKAKEIADIRAVCRLGKMEKVKLTKIDIKLIGNDGTLYLFDLKTAKPNAGEFKGFKQTLLRWTAASLAVNPSTNVQSFIAIPYNPYEPQAYNRWTMRGMLDLNNELKVANEFWDFIGGTGAYQDLLDIFERIGIELRSEIDEYFARYNRKS